MSGKYLLDTNAAIELMRGGEGIRKVLATSSEVFLSTTVVGELHYGAENSRRVEANRSRIVELVAGFAVIRLDVATAARYGKVKSQLKASGQPIPENDIWIAATALQHGTDVLTLDRHFGSVEGLVVVGW